MKNLSYNIRMANNGFIVKKEWTEDNEEGYNWKTEENIFTAWADVLEFITNNKLY